MTQRTGIDAIAMATGRFAMDLAELADHGGIDVGKYYAGLGQTTQTVVAAHEDVVTLAAAAAEQVIAETGVDGIRTILLATESGVDQSKSAAVNVQGLLGLPAAVRAVELKQACYSGTAALQFAAGIVARDPAQRVLVITSDVAHYDLDSAGEATQGAAAVAMLVTADPRIVEIEEATGLYTADVQDFWRPNYRSTPVVDGKLSIDTYLEAVERVWKDYATQGGRNIAEFAGFCYHQPFTKMAYKAHTRLLELHGIVPTRERLDADLAATTIYNRTIGNSYTASLYLALLSLLDHADDLTDRPIALFSYGSGCVAELFAVRPVAGYRQQLPTAATAAALARREPISYAGYRALRESSLPEDGGDAEIAGGDDDRFRLTGVSGHTRRYRAARTR